MLAAPDLSAIRLDVALPTMHRVRQRFDAPVVDDVEGETRRQVRRFAGSIKPGARIAITAGSRGIANIARIIKAAGDEVRALGGEPFIMPAMGSHGKATAEGQIEMLEELGITEASTGLRIVSSMDVREVGRIAEVDMPCYVGVTALEADGVILVNRVKPHTDFNGPIESGLSKICTIGLGKQLGAQTIHSYGVPGLKTWMPKAARVIVEKANVLFGVAVVENAYDQTAIIEAVPSPGIAGADEERLQQTAKSLMASLPFDELDVLVVDEMGKQVSGAGMDTNVIGRMLVRGSEEFERPRITNIAVLDLTDGSHGNAAGLGLADFTTQRLLNKVDFAAYYINCITAGIGGVQRGQVPMVLPTDRDAVSAAIRMCGEPRAERVGVMHIKNTLRIGEIEISASLLEQARALPHLDVDPDGRPLTFDQAGRIVDLWGVPAHAGH
ncbi:MAG: DUF2088 domain-containing protein [Chloroflexota bacterium]|nr:DUF2088 domain-containing protein [Chloroflexota bacterium]